MQAAPETWHSAPAQSPLGVIRAYYEALQRRDVPAILTAWSQPPARLGEKLQRVESVEIHDLKPGETQTDFPLRFSAKQLMSKGVCVFLSLL
jgi:hypothetical protein